jgi:hypothetical protein
MSSVLRAATATAADGKPVLLSHKPRTDGSGTPAKHEMTRTDGALVRASHAERTASSRCGETTATPFVAAISITQDMVRVTIE